MSEEKKLKNFEYLIPILILIVGILILIKTGIIKNIPIIGDFFKGTINVLVIGNNEDETTAIVQNWLNNLKLSYPINYYVSDPNGDLSDISNPNYFDKYDIIILAYQGEYPRELLNALRKYDKNIIVFGMAGEKVKGEPDTKGWGLLGFNVVSCNDPLATVCDYDEVYLGDIYLTSDVPENPIVKELTGTEYFAKIPMCDEKSEDCNKVIKIYNVNPVDSGVKEIIKLIITVGDNKEPKSVLFERDGLNGKKFYFAYISDDTKTHILFDNVIKYIAGYI